MKRAIIMIVLVSIAVSLTTCKKIIFREIECRPFNLTEEFYWNPLENGDTVVYINSSGARILLTVADKQISHRTKYTSDTGCGCLDESGMLMTNNSDSIWFQTDLRYVEDQSGNRQEEVVFVMNNKQSVFYETHITMIESYSIENLSFLNVKKFEYNYADNQRVKTVYLVKNLGIIRFEMVNGEVWTNENLTNYVTIEIETFTYTENTCK